MARQGAIDSPPKTPFIMGSECAGDIEQVGEGVENFKVRISKYLIIHAHAHAHVHTYVHTMIIALLYSELF